MSSDDQSKIDLKDEKQKPYKLIQEHGIPQVTSHFS